MSRRAEPEDLYTVVRTVDLLDPVLVVHFDGWIDAGQSAAAAAQHLIRTTGAEPLVRFDTEWLVDHRARRPTMHIVDGVNAGIDWPTIEMTAGRDLDDRDVIILSGAEPDHNWRSFIEAVEGLVEQFGVRRMVGLGAYPAAVPHTRPARLTITSPTVDLARSNEPRATLDVPAGVAATVEAALDAAGVEAFTMWAQVPHYIPAAAYPPATLALVEGLAENAGVRVDPGPLSEMSLTARNRLDRLIADEESHKEMLTELERRHDETTPSDETLPTSDELAAQIEQFLRTQDGDTE
ncbi:MAG: PAC2 family protein [Actinobacteria bacterium]|nr:PAC2 family protein [Actinomycetota bacterium]NIS31088.1 PAC2 family protein [Actinomycetota bacterium]NIT95473.1 PAC2 family protein [Actinomycetota bacterium]NIU19155.1 PAC2 family protein [Actinomycetota bacterium]NIU66249.1 PAC2 family protein [Actinomycetota bacterium]